MNKSKKVRNVFFLLREHISVDDLSNRELLKSSNDLVNLFDSNINPRCEIRTGGTPFHTWGIDTGFRQGPWKILSHEINQGTFCACDQCNEWEGIELNLREGLVDIEKITEKYLN